MARDFNRDAVLARAANYIDRAENALEAAAGNEGERMPDLDPQETLLFASAAASTAAALIAYAEAGGVPFPEVR